MKRIITLVLLFATYVASAQTIIKCAPSINPSDRPLWVVNNIALTDEKVSEMVEKALKPEDVESMTLLKGAEATALYGSSARNGVVIITLKKSQTNSNVAAEKESLSVTGASFATHPLVVVDGKEIPTTDEAAMFMKNLLPEKIESITVLKDPNALAKYGDRGKNGVLFVNLKK